MRTIICLSWLLIGASWAPAQEAAPLVVDLTGGGPRELVVILDGRAVRVTSLPLESAPPVPAPAPGPGPGLDRMETAASGYARASLDAAAAGYETAAAAIEAGRSVKDALAEGARRTEQLRKEAFARLVAPEFARVLPEGTEPADPAQRAQVIAVYRRFAGTLRGPTP